ncbi:SDR family oxidoreductase [Sorangium sp. So ce1128]
MTNAGVALITGASKGIGYEAARQLAEQGFTVLIGARDARRGQEAVDRLRSSGADAHLVHIDVADEASVSNAASLVAERFGRLDVLVNNAAVHREIGVAQRPSELSLDVLRDTYAANVFGPFLTIKHFAALLRRSSSPRVINVSSTMGSLTSISDPAHWLAGVNTLAYSSSKTALNALTVAFAKDLAADGIAVSSICPGWVKTDMGGEQAPRTVEQGARIIVELAAAATPPTGKFVDENGVVPW